jgi:hypothetical protein
MKPFFDAIEDNKIISSDYVISLFLCDYIEWSRPIILPYEFPHED